jgi:hypothetical protein
MKTSLLKFASTLMKRNYAGMAQPNKIIDSSA